MRCERSVYDIHNYINTKCSDKYKIMRDEIVEYNQKTVVKIL